MNWYPQRADVIDSNDPSDEGALEYALYAYLRNLSEIKLTLEDWQMLQVVSETAHSLRAVGIMCVLPTGELPIEVELTRREGSLDYIVRLGASDALWSSLSESKRWKAVYLYAVGERAEEWTWSESVAGSCDIRSGNDSKTIGKQSPAGA